MNFFLSSTDRRSRSVKSKLCASARMLMTFVPDRDVAYFVTIHKRYREDKMDVQPAVAAAPAEESEEEEEVVLESGVLGDPVVRD